MIEKVEFANAFSFKYSPRPGTPAAELRDQIPESVKSERLARLQTASRPASGGHSIAKMAGRTLDVLIEKPGRHAGQIVGKSPYLQPVQIEGSLDHIGEIVRAEIVSAGANSLFGRLLPDRAVARGASLKPPDRSAPFTRQEVKRNSGRGRRRRDNLGLRRQSPCLARLRTIRPEPCQARTQARRDRQCERQSRDDQGPGGGVRTCPAGLGKSLCTGGAWPAGRRSAMSTARSRRAPCKALCSPRRTRPGAPFSNKSAPAGAVRFARATWRKTFICAR